MEIVRDQEGRVYNIYLGDEIPKFKSGWRIITAEQVGSKWVKLRCGTRTKKVPLKLWITLLQKNMTRSK